MTDHGKSCMMCSHFSFSLGSRAYSQYTPGDCGEARCKVKAQEELKPPSDEDEFRAWVRFGNACQKFEPAEAVPIQHRCSACGAEAFFRAKPREHLFFCSQACADTYPWGEKEAFTLERPL